MICLEILLYYECSTVSNTINVYQAFNFRKINNLFVVSARLELWNLFYSASTPVYL